MIEVYGAKHCQYTNDLVEELEWQGQAFVYFDVDKDSAALQKMLELTQNQRAIPVLVEDGHVKSIGYQGRSCAI